MKIRKVEDKPMELHTKTGPKLRIKSKGKTNPGRMKVHKVKKSPPSGLKQRVETSNASIQVKRQQLHVMGRAALKEMDGGEEVAESIDVAATVAYPLTASAKKGDTMLRNKKHKQQADKKKTDDKAKRSRYRRTASDDGIKAQEIARRKASVKAKESNLKKKDGGSKGDGSKKSSGTKGAKSTRSRMITTFISNMRASEEEKLSVSQAAKQTVKREFAILIKKIIAMILPGFLGLFSVIALCGIVVVAVLAVIYNSPFAIFFPLPDSGTEDPRSVLVSYYQEFNEKVADIEGDGDSLVYKNTEDGVPVSNFNDTLMVYMLIYGDGEAGYVMDEEGKNNLKKIFDEMNYISAASSAVEMDVGDSLGKVWVTAYCPCSICCGPYANGITASAQGKTCYQKAQIINKKDLQPGDLIFYSYEDNGQFRNISHVAIYVGDGKMVHAANPSRGVVLDPLRTGSVVFYARPYR